MWGVGGGRGARDVFVFTLSIAKLVLDLSVKITRELCTKKMFFALLKKLQENRYS